MRLFGYYFTHTFVNGIRKLFRTWVAYFLIFCLLCGLIGGIAGFALGYFLDDTLEEEPPVVEEEVLPIEPPDPETLMKVVEAVSGVVLLGALLLFLYSGVKNGASIFQMADVNYLFPAPLRPQSVLLFRTVLQMAGILVASVWILFQVPNLILNLGLGWVEAAAFILGWILLLVIGQVISVGVYTVAATHTRVKRYVRPAVVGIVLAIAAVYGGLVAAGKTPLDAFTTLFASPATRAVPFVGWLRGMVIFAIEGKWWMAALCLAANLLGVVGLIYLIWHIRADFYEDSLAGAEKLFKAQQAQQTGRAERAEVKRRNTARLQRERIGYGRGALMFFARPFYHRCRTAYLGYFTKTSLLYLSMACGVTVLTRFAFDSHSITALAIVMLCFVYMRNLGNPLSDETSENFIYLVPEGPFAKLGASLLAGSVDTLLDLLPAFALSAILLGESAGVALGWLAVILTLDFFASATGSFTVLSLPSSLPELVSGFLNLILRMLFLLPGMLLLLIPSLFGLLPLALLLTTGYHLLIGTVFFLLCPLFLAQGKA